MELSTVEYTSARKLWEKLQAAKELKGYIVMEGEESAKTKGFHFTHFLHYYKQHFPASVEKQVSLRNKALGKLKPAQKAALLQTFEAEVQQMVQELMEVVQAPKTIHGAMLPSELGECKRKVRELEALKEKQIKDLQLELNAMQSAEQVLELWEQIEAIAKTLAPSASSSSQPNNNKRQKA